MKHLDKETIMAQILIIDDDKSICVAMSSAIERMGHDVGYALTLKEGLREVSLEPFDVVFLDVRLPDGNGLAALPKIRGLPSSPEVIVITGEGEPDGAEVAIKSGAWDYIEKPTMIKEMMLPLVRALQYREEKKKEKPRAALKRGGIVGSSPQLQECLDLLAEAATSEENVLITGETGTGKELFAKAIHENSHRSGQNLVVVDCTALPGTLVESILFGHEKGAFTGADKAYTGLIKQASGGTLFLDEVGELPPSLQKSFIRVLQERRFRPLGGPQEIKSNFRLVVATNRDLDKMVEAGQFRKDLLFRLKSLVLHLPPLKERFGDIKEIVINYLRKVSDESKTDMKGFSPEFFHTLEQYDWPGNVRELLNIIERAVVSSRDEPTLFPKHLPMHIRVHLARTSVMKDNEANSERIPDIQKQLPKLKDYRDVAVVELEREYLQKLMSLPERDIKEACRISGLSRSRLYHLLKKHKISGS